MTPHYSDDWLTIYGGDCREVLASLPSDSVDCVVTSPPYWGLRDYGNDGQLGLERTPEEYVANMVAVFAEVRRVLKPSGTCWLNLGDSYASSPPGLGRAVSATSGLNGAQTSERYRDRLANSQGTKRNTVVSGLKPKDLVGIPWRVAFALQADGWYLRSDIIWSKPNPMPESVTDRPTKAHEYLFLLTKSARYYFDADAVRESLAESTERIHSSDRVVPTYGGRKTDALGGGHSGLVNGTDRLAKMQAAGGRNIRSVWTIATRPYPGAHFAVFPPELPERCIKAGSSEKGVCPECGAPWERVIERSGLLDLSRPQAKRAKELADAAGLTPEHITAIRSVGVTDAGKARVTQDGTGKNTEEAQRLADEAKAALGGYYREFLLDRGQTAGWRPTCDIAGLSVEIADTPKVDREAAVRTAWPPIPPPVPAVILDPFAGSGTVGMVANRLSRRAILIDLNPEYLKQQMTRNSQVPLGLTEGDAA